MENGATARETYDGVTIFFHWVTAALILVLLGTSFGWKYLPRSWEFKQYEGLHVSLGIALAAVIVARLLWRAFAGKRLPSTGSQMSRLASRVVHILLYVAVVVQVGLGFALRWTQGERFTFFGWFDIPKLFASDHNLARQIEELHNLAAWGILILVAAHTAAALIHRYVFKDGVLRRMLPIAG